MVLSSALPFFKTVSPADEDCVYYYYCWASLSACEKRCLKHRNAILPLRWILDACLSLRYHVFPQHGTSFWKRNPYYANDNADPKKKNPARKTSKT